MWQWLANSKLTRYRKFRIPFVEEKFVTCFLVLYLRKSFLRDYDGKGVQKRVIILINTFKAEGTLANDSLYIMKLNQFSSFRIFLREPDAQVEIKFDKGKVYYLTCNFVKFKSFWQWSVCSLWQPFSLVFQRVVWDLGCGAHIVNEKAPFDKKKYKATGCLIHMD